MQGVLTNKLKPTLILRLVLFIIILLILGCENKEPLIRVINDNHPVVIKGDTTIFYLKFSNIGGQCLKINKITSSCSCIDYEFSDECLKPNKIDSIKLIFKKNNNDLVNDEIIVINSNSEKNIKIVNLKLQNDTKSK
jgi:hypothetical protein